MAKKNQGKTEAASTAWDSSSFDEHPLQWKRKYIPLHLLTLNEGQVPGIPKNPRFIKDERYAKLVDSLRETPEMLEVRELIVVAFGKNYVVLGGNMRLRAATEIGLQQVPVKEIHEDTPTKLQRAIAIKDNEQYGETDMDILANEWSIEELLEFGMELPPEWQHSEEDFGDEFSLPDDDKPPYGQMTFMLSNEQIEVVKAALQKARDINGETYGNENSNGNALYWMAQAWLMDQ